MSEEEILNHLNLSSDSADFLTKEAEKLLILYKKHPTLKLRNQIEEIYNRMISEDNRLKKLMQEYIEL